MSSVFAYDYHQMDPYNDTLLNNLSTHTHHERSIIYNFLINHSFNLILSKYQHKFLHKDFKGLNGFIQQLFARLQLNLSDYQKFLILMVRFCNNLDDGYLIQLSPKHFILGLIIKLKQDILKESIDWFKVTGLSDYQVGQLLLHFVVLDNEELLIIDCTELEKMSSIWKKLVYSKFQII